MCLYESQCSPVCASAHGHAYPYRKTGRYLHGRTGFNLGPPQPSRGDGPDSEWGAHSIVYLIGLLFIGMCYCIAGGGGGARDWPSQYPLQCDPPPGALPVSCTEKSVIFEFRDRRRIFPASYACIR